MSSTQAPSSPSELVVPPIRLAQSAVTDAVFEQAAQHFGPNELADLVWTIAVINTWNRLGAAAHPWPLD
jgi:alkylhydroperoxidase family enzyme